MTTKTLTLAAMLQAGLREDIFADAADFVENEPNADTQALLEKLEAFQQACADATKVLNELASVDTNASHVDLMAAILRLQDDMDNMTYSLSSKEEDPELDI